MSFNQLQIFLDFYLFRSPLRSRAFVGGLERLDAGRRQLFGISKDAFDQLPDRSGLRILKTVAYPNGQHAFYLVEPARR
jgi:hypothetical protein